MISADLSIGKFASCVIAWTISFCAMGADVAFCPGKPSLAPGEWSWVLAPERTGPQPARRPVVVFVHGALSNGLEAWTHKPKANWLVGGLNLLFADDVYWPCLVATSDELGKPDVLVFEYESRLWDAGTLSLFAGPKIDIAAEQLHSALRGSGAADSSNITFVTHSMGGVVMRRALSGPSVSLRDNVKAALLYGSPSSPVELAAIVKTLSSSAQASTLADRAFFETLNDSWRKMNYQTYCVYEVETTGPTQVIERESAIGPCPRSCKRFPLQRSHIEMVKPKNALDSPHRVLVMQHQMFSTRESPPEFERPEWKEFERVVWQVLRTATDFNALKPYLAESGDFAYFDVRAEFKDDQIPSSYLPDYLSRRIGWDVRQPIEPPGAPARQTVGRFVDRICDNTISTYIAGPEPRIKTTDVAITFSPIDSWIRHVTVIARASALGPRFVGLVLDPGRDPPEALRALLRR